MIGIRKNGFKQVSVFTSAVFGIFLCCYLMTFNLTNVSHFKWVNLPRVNDLYINKALIGLKRHANLQAGKNWILRNNKYNMVAKFEAGQVNLEIKNNKEHIWKWQTEAISRAGEKIVLGKAVQIAHGNRVEYRYKALTEWYENSEAGLEQGFVINKRIPGNNNYFKITSLPISHYEARLTGPDNIDFYLENKKIMTYNKLKAWDATGRILPSEMQINGRQVALLINDSNAVYPVTVDPLITTPAWFKEGDQGNAYMGHCVANAGDVNGDGYNDVIVGMPDLGRVYVYYGSSSGLSSMPDWIATISAASFGYSVASAGDVNGDGYGDVIIGAYNYTGLEVVEGKVFVYHGSSTGLSNPSSPDWTEESDVDETKFGYSVASAGDVNGDGYGDIIVSAIGAANSYAGQVSVYLGSVSGLSHTVSWAKNGENNNDNFGCSIANAGDVNGDGYGDIIIGAKNFANGQNYEGKAYVYHGSSTGLSSNPDWIEEGDVASVEFGKSAASAGDVNGDGYADVVVGAGFASEGYAYVYLGSSTGLADTPVWNQTNINPYGSAVSSAGDINDDGYSDIIVASYSFNDDQTQEGRIYVYLGTSTGISSGTPWTMDGNSDYAYFGWSLSGCGDVNGDGYGDVIVGAKNYSNDQINEGRVYVYHGSPAGMANDANWACESDQGSARAGYSLADAGDINGDGYADVIIGVPDYDAGVSDCGRILLYYGYPTGLSTTANQIIDGTMAGEHFGYSVAGVGDLNGDGYADIGVSAPDYSNGENDEGRLYIYYGGASGIDVGGAVTIESNVANAKFGFDIAPAGDVNGDGYHDILISAPFYNDLGRVFLFYGTDSGLNMSPVWAKDGDQYGAQFGYAISCAGDINADGFSDVLIGAPFYDAGQSDEGRVFLFTGSNAGLVSSSAWSTEGNQVNAQYGYAVSTAGDVNQDGYSDVAIGANLYDGTQSNEGRVSVFHGNASGLAGTPNWTKDSGQNSARFGGTINCAGDVNNDGYSDLIVGSPQYGNGRAFVYYGGSSGLSATEDWAKESDQGNTEFGFAVSSAGDVNGDGYADILVGSPAYDNGSSDEGRAYLFYGNNGNRKAVLPCQLRPSGLTRIASGGTASSSGANTDVIIKMFAKSSYGRSRAKLQVQVAPVGQALSTGLIYTQSGYTMTGVGGSNISYTIGGLNTIQSYNWRARLIFDPNYSGNGFLQTHWYSPPTGSLAGSGDFKTGPVAQATATPTPVPAGTKTATPTITQTYTITPTHTMTTTPMADFGGKLISKNYVYTAPNPARGDYANFTVHVPQACEVEVDVYTATNKYVMTFNMICDSPGKHQKPVYMGNLANGVYMFLVKANNNQGKTERVIKKIALIK